MAECQASGFGNNLQTRTSESHREPTRSTLLIPNMWIPSVLFSNSIRVLLLGKQRSYGGCRKNSFFPIEEPGISVGDFQRLKGWPSLDGGCVSVKGLVELLIHSFSKYSSNAAWHYTNFIGLADTLSSPS